MTFSSHKMDYKHIIIISLLILSSKLLLAQDSSSTLANQNVTLFVDPRIAILSNYNLTYDKTNNVVINKPNTTGSIHSARGFRIIIYTGTDRKQANDTKVDFLRKYPNVRVYMTYSLPHYKIKVGDFTSREDASVLYSKLNKNYSPCLIVPDIVEINTFKSNNDNQN